jgi:hypothetical protein
VQYVLLDLPDAPRDPSQPDPFGPGARLAVRIDPSTGRVRVSSVAVAADAADANTPAPAVLEGRFEETVGSVLVVRPPPTATATSGGGDEERRTRPRREDGGGDEAAPPRPPDAAVATVVATVETRIVRA